MRREQSIEEGLGGQEAASAAAEEGECEREQRQEPEWQATAGGCGAPYVTVPLDMQEAGALLDVAVHEVSVAPMAATDKAPPEADCSSALVMVAACRTDGDSEREHSYCHSLRRRH
jgi:hypothetical protein